MDRNPSFLHLFLAFLRLGATAFGGPAMVSHIKHLTVKKKQWLDEETAVHGIVLCQALPGAMAVNFASYAGYRIKGITGMFVSFAGFALPAFLLMLFFSVVYERTHAVPGVSSLFVGLEIMVVCILVHATYFLGKNSLSSARDITLALMSASALLLKTPPLMALLGAGFMGIILYKSGGEAQAVKQVRLSRSFVHAFSLVILFLASLFCLYFSDKKLFDLATVMSKIEIVAFGGGYTALTLMAHEVVEARSWIDSKTFLDGIALGQVTPGPILITASFVGYLIKGVQGAVVGTVYIFAPGLVLITLTLPFLDRLTSSPIFKRVVRGIVCCFVGMLGYVSIKFAAEIPWDPARALFCTASLILVFRGLDLFWLVLAGAAVSVFIF
ncbi:MAG TPA: chromate efflux transporter [Nitrospirota bacterium]|nr:chromate efflux transporter [Nitrospirota bacterium]